MLSQLGGASSGLAGMLHVETGHQSSGGAFASLDSYLSHSSLHNFCCSYSGSRTPGLSSGSLRGTKPRISGGRRWVIFNQCESLATFDLNSRCPLATSLI